MLVPKDTSQVNYGNMFRFEVISSLDNSVIEAVPKNELSKKRALEEKQKRELEEDVDGEFNLEPETGESAKLKLTWELLTHDPQLIEF